MNTIKPWLAWVALFIAVATSSANDVQRLSATLRMGHNLGILDLGQDDLTRKLQGRFNESLVTAEIDYRLCPFLSAFGKSMHFTGSGDPGIYWNRATQLWEPLGSIVHTDGTWTGFGGQIHSRRDLRVSAGLGIGFGWLDHPDEILNSTHQQFNLAIDLTYKISDRWSLSLCREHLSNGRKFFGRGGHGSRFYPNNGRDYWTGGATYRF